MTLSAETQRQLRQQLGGEVSSTDYDGLAKAITSTLPNIKWGRVPVPNEEPAAMLKTVAALKEAVETMLRSRGSIEDSMITVHDLIVVLNLLVPFIIDEVRKEFHP